MDKRCIKYGTPLIDEDDIPDDEHLKGGGLLFKKPVQVFDQVVTDEKGRRRFHGAFTGGFSAGYFNTVGTPEGWAPSTFKSSREAKNDKKSSKPEDFMDEEDFDEYGIAPKNIDITKMAERAKLPNIKGTEYPDVLMDFFTVSDSNTIGISIFLAQGGKSGRGVGELITTKHEIEKHSTETNSLEKTYGCALPPNLSKKNDLLTKNLQDQLFEILPHDVKPYIINPKTDHCGLKTMNECKNIQKSQLIPKTNLEQESFAFALGSTFMETVKSQKRKGITGQAFGYGALEDSDDEYEIWNDADSYGGGGGVMGDGHGGGAAIDGDTGTNVSKILKKYDIPLYKEQAALMQPRGSKSSTKSSNRNRRPSRFDTSDDGGINLGSSESGPGSSNTCSSIINFSIPFTKSTATDLNSALAIKSTAKDINNNDDVLIKNRGNKQQRHDFHRDSFLQRLKNLITDRVDAEVAKSGHGHDKENKEPSSLSGHSAPAQTGKSNKNRYYASSRYGKYHRLLLEDTFNFSRQNNGALVKDNKNNMSSKPFTKSSTDKIETRSNQINEPHTDKSGPLFKPFQYNPPKQARYLKFITNLESYFKSNPYANRNNRDFFNSLSPREIDHLFDNISYEGVTEWDRDREKAEFMNISKFTFLKTVDTNFKFAPEKPDFYKVEEAPPGSNVLTYGLNSRFHKSATLETLRVEETQMLQENVYEKKIRQFLEKGEFGIGKTRHLFDWVPESLLCKRFGVKFLGGFTKSKKAPAAPAKAVVEQYGAYDENGNLAPIVNPFTQQFEVQRVTQTSFSSYDNNNNKRSENRIPIHSLHSSHVPPTNSQIGVVPTNNVPSDFNTTTPPSPFPHFVQQAKQQITTPSALKAEEKHELPVKPHIPVSKTLPPEILKAIFDSSDDSMDSEEEIEMFKKENDPRYKPSSTTKTRKSIHDDDVVIDSHERESKADDFIMSILKSTLPGFQQA